MGRVTVVQHAEKQRTAGDPGLTELGHHQSRRTASFLARQQVDVLRCSPLLRTLQTAAPIAEALSVEVQREERLVERMNWDGSVLLELFLADWARATEDRDFGPVVGESSRSAGARFADVVLEGSTVDHQVLVTHGGVTIDGLRSLLGEAVVAKAVPGWRDGVPSAALTVLEVDGGLVELVSGPDVSHLV
jgi:broad specificity phosphatase PhoE